MSRVPVHEFDINAMESCFDDLNEAQRLILVYKENGGLLDVEMKEFSSNLTKIRRIFRFAIKSLEQEEVTACLQAYDEALNRDDYEGKFAAHWNELLKKKVCHKFSLSKSDVHVKK